MGSRELKRNIEINSKDCMVKRKRLIDRTRPISPCQMRQPGPTMRNQIMRREPIDSKKSQMQRNATDADKWGPI